MEVTTETTTCSRKGCTNDATRRPVLVFRPKGYQNSPKASAYLDLPVCKEHATTDPDYFITDEGWAQIVASFKTQGLAEPDRSSLEIWFEEILRK